MPVEQAPPIQSLWRSPRHAHGAAAILARDQASANEFGIDANSSRNGDAPLIGYSRSEVAELPGLIGQRLFRPGHGVCEGTVNLDIFAPRAIFCLHRYYGRSNMSAQRTITGGSRVSHAHSSNLAYNARTRCQVSGEAFHRGAIALIIFVAREIRVRQDMRRLAELDDTMLRDIGSLGRKIETDVRVGR